MSASERAVGDTGAPTGAPDTRSTASSSHGTRWRHAGASRPGPGLRGSIPGCGATCSSFGRYRALKARAATTTGTLDTHAACVIQSPDDATERGSHASRCPRLLPRRVRLQAGARTHRRRSLPPWRVMSESEHATQLAVRRPPVSSARIMRTERGLVEGRQGRLAVPRRGVGPRRDLHRCRLAPDGLAARLAAEPAARSHTERVIAHLDTLDVVTRENDDTPPPSTAAASP